MLRDTEAPLRPSWLLLGPAFVAAIAYVDPGNVAANVSAGAQFGFLLVWVIFMANAMAGLVQYLSAKLGLVSGRTLPEAVADHTRTPTRIAYWLQAELVAMATDLAEVVGGAIALYLLFDLPMLVGGIITGAVSLLLLAVQNRRGQRMFERVISGLLLIIAIGFLTSLFVEPPPAADIAAGLVPRFEGAESVLLATAMLGATVMPHAVYLHSGLARDRHGHPEAGPAAQLAAAGHPHRRRAGDAGGGRGEPVDAADRRDQPAGPRQHRLHRGRARSRPGHARPDRCAVLRHRTARLGTRVDVRRGIRRGDDHAGPAATLIPAAGCAGWSR